ncbi:MAG: glycosyltransferase family 2 protein [Bacteroidaceae bacterium]|nr:glycosyltransferase family 2 protein [Bacteroidaceae bacterium]
MSKGLIGVIVPVYKVEKYIAECIESILAQTYTNFRLILVDDGTPDNSGKICDEYAKKDSRITVIHKKNAGVTRARARGVEEADDCEFITFVDSDDTIPIDSLQILIGLIDDNTDIVVGEYQELGNTSLRYFNQKEYILNLIFTGVPQAPWGKVIRKELFTEKTFNIPSYITVGEDAIMNIRIATNSTKNIIFTKQKIYNYRILPESAFHSFKNTLTYQEKYFNVLEESLPGDLYKDVLPQIIARAFSNWKPFYQYSSKKLRADDIPFVNRLKRYIKECNYKLTVFDWIQLYCPIKFIRYISINIRKIVNKIKDKK